MSYNQYYDRGSKSQFPYQRIPPVQNRARDPQVRQLLLEELYDQTEDRSLGSTLSLAQIETDEIKERQFNEERRRRPQVAPKLLSTEFGIADSYLKFDSRARDSSSDISNGLLSFNITELNQNQPIENIIEMQIGTFFIPDIATPVDVPDYFFFKQVTILIEEMQGQAHFGPDGTRYHFDLRVIPAGIANELVPAANEGKFIFTKPFRDISLMSLRFKAPFKNIVFPDDVLPFNASPGTSPARIITAAPHGLPVASTVAIFVSDFVSGIGNVDNIINSPDGHMVTVIDATTLEFSAAAGFDFAGVLTAVPGNAFIGERGIRFSMRFRTLVNIKTNTIVPV